MSWIRNTGKKGVKKTGTFLEIPLPFHSQIQIQKSQTIKDLNRDPKPWY
jgi:hypothetical protein